MLVKWNSSGEMNHSRVDGKVKPSYKDYKDCKPTYINRYGQKQHSKQMLDVCINNCYITCSLPWHMVIPMLLFQCLITKKEVKKTLKVTCKRKDIFCSWEHTFASLKLLPTQKLKNNLLCLQGIKLVTCLDFSVKLHHLSSSPHLLCLALTSEPLPHFLAHIKWARTDNEGNVLLSAVLNNMLLISTLA